MRRKKQSKVSSFNISPINPSIHFVLFLILALVLVVIVGYVMQQTADATRARLICPQSQTDPKDLISELSRRCANGVEYVKDGNNCNVWVCRKKPSINSPLPLNPKNPAGGSIYYPQPPKE